MAVPARDIAAALRERLPGIGTMKLHKLLYYCQGIHLAHTGKQLFDDTICAWDMGPVVAPLWRAENAGETKPSGAELDNAELGTINYVISTYGALSGADLSKLTHQESPWIRGDEQRRERGTASADIRVEWLAEYFTKAARETAEGEGSLDDDVIHEWLSEVAARPYPKPGTPATRESLAAWARRGA